MTARVAVVQVALATLLFSFNPLLFGAMHLDPLEILWAVSAIAAAAMGATLAWQRRFAQVRAVVRARWGLVVLLGLAFTLNNLLYIYAVKTTTVANSVLTHYAAPFVVFLLGTLFLGERISRRAIVSLGLAFAGLVLLLRPTALVLTDRQTIGILLGLGSAVFFAQEIVLKKLVIAGQSAFAVVFAYLAAGSVLMSPFVRWRVIGRVSWHDLGLLALCGIGAGVVGNVLFMRGLDRVRAQQASVISYIEPLGAIVWGLVWLREVPGIETIAGGALILGATGLVVTDERRRRQLA